MPDAPLSAPISVPATTDELSPWTSSTILEGNPRQGIHYLFRGGSTRTSGWAAIWWSEPCSLRFAPKTDCTMFVVDGEQDVQFADGSSMTVGPGDAIAVPGGTVATCHIKTNFREFVTFA